MFKEEQKNVIVEQKNVNIVRLLEQARTIKNGIVPLNKGEVIVDELKHGEDILEDRFGHNLSYYAVKYMVYYSFKKHKIKLFGFSISTEKNDLNFFNGDHTTFENKKAKLNTVELTAKVNQKIRDFRLKYLWENKNG